MAQTATKVLVEHDGFLNISVGFGHISFRLIINVRRMILMKLIMIP